MVVHYFYYSARFPLKDTQRLRHRSLFSFLPQSEKTSFKISLESLLLNRWWGRCRIQILLTYSKNFWKINYTFLNLTPSIHGLAYLHGKWFKNILRKNQKSNPESTSCILWRKLNFRFKSSVWRFDHELQITKWL